MDYPKRKWLLFLERMDHKQNAIEILSIGVEGKVDERIMKNKQLALVQNLNDIQSMCQRLTFGSLW